MWDFIFIGNVHCLIVQNHLKSNLSLCKNCGWSYTPRSWTSFFIIFERLDVDKALPMIIFCALLLIDCNTSLIYYAWFTMQWLWITSRYGDWLKCVFLLLNFRHEDGSVNFWDVSLDGAIRLLYKLNTANLFGIDTLMHCNGSGDSELYDEWPPFRKVPFLMIFYFEHCMKLTVTVFAHTLNFAFKKCC